MVIGYEFQAEGMGRIDGETLDLANLGPTSWEKSFPSPESSQQQSSF